MASLKTVRKLENQLECAYQHIEDLWEDRCQAIKEFLYEHTDWVRVHITSNSYYLVAPEMTTHIIDYTHNLLSKEKKFSYDDAKELVRNTAHNHHLGHIMLKGELTSKHLMERYLEYLKKEYPDCVLDMTFMIEESKEDKEI